LLPFKNLLAKKATENAYGTAVSAIERFEWLSKIFLIVIKSAAIKNCPLYFQQIFVPAVY
jgi:hypothetical protein